MMAFKIDHPPTGMCDDHIHCPPKNPLHCTKMDKISWAAYNFASAGIKWVMNISYNILLKTKLSFLFKAVHFCDKSAKITNVSFLPFSGNYEAPQLCLYTNFLDHEFVVTVGY